MDLSKRYFVTGTCLTVFLVGLVLIARFLQGDEVSLASQNLKAKGSESAPIHLVVYSDFQCPACRAALEPVEALRREFAGSIRLEFRHFPLERPHPWALTAASFAECAAQQGKFWEYHDRLYAEQSVWSVSPDAISMFARYAQELNLNPEELSNCLGNSKTIVSIRKERTSGEKKGVQSTPTVFINDQVMVGGLQVKEKGRNIIVEELAKKGVRVTESGNP